MPDQPTDPTDTNIDDESEDKPKKRRNVRSYPAATFEDSLILADEPPRVMRRLDPLGGWSHDRATTAGEVSGRAA